MLNEKYFEIEKGIATIPTVNEEPLSSQPLPLPPLLTAMPHSLLQQHHSHLNASHLSNVNSDLVGCQNTRFGLLQFPALKKFVDSQSVERKHMPHLSAFSSIKPKQGIILKPTP